MDVDGPHPAEVVVAPDEREDLLARVDASREPHQQLEQLVLHERQVERPAVQPYLVRERVQDERPSADRVVELDRRTMTQQREPCSQLRGGIRHGQELIEQMLVAGQVPQVRLVDQPEQRHRPARLRAAQCLRVRHRVVAHVVRQDQRDARTGLRRRALGLRMEQRPVAQHDEVRHELLSRGARVREDEHDASRRDLLRSVLRRRRPAERGQSLGRFRSSSSPVT